MNAELQTTDSQAASPAALLDQETIASLAGAKTLLAQVPGFLYLPIFVPNEVTASLVQTHLCEGLQPQPFEISWPMVQHGSIQPGIPAEPTDEQWNTALKELLEFFDHGISRQSQGGTLLINACSAARHGLAERFVPLLNQRREAMRQRELRLILLWPSVPELRHKLIEAAADLWSMRAASPMIEAAVLPDVQSWSSDKALSDSPAHLLSQTAENQLLRWSVSERLRAADLSIDDAKNLLSALFDAKDWVRLDRFSQRLFSELESGNCLEQDDDSLRSHIMSHLSNSRAQLGDSLAGLYWGKQATEIDEKLAADNFAAYAPDLASSLSNLSVRLAEAGQLEQGLVAIRRAVEIREKLATENSAVYAADLARSLNNLSNLLAETGQREQGLAAIRRSLVIRERLAAKNFTTYAPDLATSLHNLSVRLAEAGQREQGFVAIQRAVEIREKLAADNYAAFAPALAGSLHNLSIRLAETGQLEQSLVAIHRAVDIREKLAAENFAAYAPNLAHSLHNLSGRLVETGQPQQGLVAAERACELIEQFAKSNTPYTDWQQKMIRRRDRLRTLES